MGLGIVNVVGAGRVVSGSSTMGRRERGILRWSGLHDAQDLVACVVVKLPGC